eukprot:g9159.t1
MLWKNLGVGTLIVGAEDERLELRYAVHSTELMPQSAMSSPRNLFHVTVPKMRSQQFPPSNQALLDAAPCRRDTPIAPAHGGVGYAASSAVPGKPGEGNITGRAGAGVGAGKPMSSGKGKGGNQRVARLGSALDDVETRANRAGRVEGRAGRGPAQVTSTAAAATAPIEGTVSLRTVGKTVAFLAKLAAPAAGGREGDDGAFGGGSKMAGSAGTGCAYGLRQQRWYSAAAAKIISDEAHDEGSDLEDEAALALERRLHAPPAIQFVSKSRRGGFNKGSTITYGSTITLQAFHGGILCFNSKASISALGKAQASALGAQPNALLTVWNLQDLQSNGPVKYGDVLFLQMGRHEVMGSSLIMHKEPRARGGLRSSNRKCGAGPYVSTRGAGEQDAEKAARDKVAARVIAGPLKTSAVGGAGGSGGGPGAAVGNPVAVPFRGNNMDKAKHTGRWVIFHKDDPEGTQGLEVCHLDRIVLMQTWLSLASDRPGDACLKQCGSVDDFCLRQQKLRASQPTNASTSGGGDGGRGVSFRAGESSRRSGAGARVSVGGEGRDPRPMKGDAKNVFTVRPECGWLISGVEDSGSGKRTGGAGGRSSATLLEGAAARQLRRSKSARMVVATNAIMQMRGNGQSIVLKAQETFDEGQRRRLASLGQKFLRAFRRERSRDWLPNRGSDRQLSIVYGPASPWGKREALRLQREKNKQSEKVTVKAKTSGDVRNPTPFEVARAENGALATEAKVKQEVWDALLKRYGYQEVTDMLALMHSASVIRRAVRAMRQRKWTRKLARIDPEMVEKVERLRKIQEQRKANMRGGASTASTARGTDTPTSATNLVNSEGEAIDGAFASGASTLVGPATGVVGAAPASSDPSHRQPRPYEALLAGSLEKFESNDQARGGVVGAGRSGSAFREFGGDGMGGVVDQQLSRDLVLLDDLRGTSSGGGTSSTAAHTVSNDDTGSTTTSTTANSTGSCGHRTAPAPLTDGERMSLLQHVRPSVFGEPTALDEQRRKVVVYPRPRSAAATTAGGGHALHHNRHDIPRATTARRRSREGEQGRVPDVSSRIHRTSVCDSSVGASRHGGVLVHDGWVAGGGEPNPCSLSVSNGVGQASPRGTRLRTGRFGGAGGNGSTRPVSLVNSVAFGVNMGVLNALSDTTASATAATAFASAVAGEATTTANSVLSATSTTRPWVSSEGERRSSGPRRTEMPRHGDSRHR